MIDTQDQRIERQERAAQNALLNLIETVDELLAFVDTLFEPRIKYDRTNGADVMALTFATKQDEHMRSVRALIDAGLHRDAHLIGRVMLEGFAIQRWAFRSAPGRTDRWFWFGAIADWRQTLENEVSGRVVVDADKKKELKRYVD